MAGLAGDAVLAAVAREHLGSPAARRRNLGNPCDLLDALYDGIERRVRNSAASSSHDTWCRAPRMNVAYHADVPANACGRCGAGSGSGSIPRANRSCPAYHGADRAEKALGYRFCLRSVVRRFSRGP